MARQAKNIGGRKPTREFVRTCAHDKFYMSIEVYLRCPVAQFLLHRAFPDANNLQTRPRFDESRRYVEKFSKSFKRNESSDKDDEFGTRIDVEFDSRSFTASGLKDLKIAAIL